MVHSEFLKERRMAIGLSQSKVADILGYSSQAISSWESGRSFPDLSIWSKYASLLEVDLQSFVFCKEKKENLRCDNLCFDLEKFCRNLKYLRKKNNLTQHDLAKLLDVNNKTILAWEKGLSFPSLPIFIKICNLYKLTADELYFVIQEEKYAVSNQPIKRKNIFFPIILPLIIVVAGGGTAAGIISASNRNKRNTPKESVSVIDDETLVSESETSSIESESITSEISESESSEDTSEEPAVEHENLGKEGEFLIDYIIDKDANHIYDVLHPESLYIYIFNKSGYQINEIDLSIDGIEVIVNNDQFVQYFDYVEINKSVLSNVYTSYQYVSKITLNEIKYQFNDEIKSSTCFNNVLQLGIVNSDNAKHIKSFAEIYNSYRDYDYYIFDDDVLIDDYLGRDFNGIINGNGHGIKSTKEKQNKGLFNMFSGVIYNLNIKDITIETSNSGNFALLINSGNNYAISKVSLNNISITNNSEGGNVNASFLVASSQNGSIEQISINSSSLSITSNSVISMAGFIGYSSGFNYYVRDSIITNTSMLLNSSAGWCTLAGIASTRVYSLKRNIIYNCHLLINTGQDSNFGGILYEQASEVVGCLYLKNNTSLNKPSHPPLIIWYLEVNVVDCYHSIDNIVDFNKTNETRRDGEIISDLSLLKDISFYKGIGYRNLMWDLSNISTEDNYYPPYLKFMQN